MPGNENSGRKPLEHKSTQYRFMMPHYINEALEKEARRFDLDEIDLLKIILMEHLKIKQNK